MQPPFEINRRWWKKNGYKTAFFIGLFIFGLVVTFKIVPGFVKLIKLGQKNSQAKISLAQTVEKSLTGTQGTYAIAIKNLKTGESYFSKEHQNFSTGSLYKLWIMAVAFQQMDQGAFIGSDILEDDAANLNNEFGVDPETAELSSGTITLSVDDALEQMITISHNYAAFLLTNKVKLSAVDQFLIQEGFSQSRTGGSEGTPESTAYDMMMFYEHLYKGDLAGKEATSKMLELLKRQQLNNALPRLLPENTAVAHKTGTLDNFDHDAGIVFSPKGDYIIVVLSESDFPLAAEDRIAQLSRDVYDYFNNS